ncbi:MAG: hypothetical protein LBQ31_05320, partial [Bacteroidales bacterium]|nr:hypothetical protein [Bacteroidales bacterium]
MYRTCIFSTFGRRKLFLFLLLSLNIPLFGATHYFVGFTAIPASGNNTQVIPQNTLGETLLTVFGAGHTYNPTNGDTVFLAVGKYMLTSEITIPAGVTVLGGYATNASTIDSLVRTYPAALWPT